MIIFINIPVNNIEKTVNQTSNNVNKTTVEVSRVTRQFEELLNRIENIDKNSGSTLGLLELIFCRLFPSDCVNDKPIISGS